jgi:hypothetical protein
MSEQDTAEVNRFLDDLDTESDAAAEEQHRRRVRAAVPKWEYMTLRAEAVGTAKACVLSVNGEEFDTKERPSFYEALARAGEDGWELVALEPGRVVMIFKRPLGEG